MKDLQEIMKQAEANDAASIFLLANDYYQGIGGLQQNHTKAMELYISAAYFGCCKISLYHFLLKSSWTIGTSRNKEKFLDYWYIFHLMRFLSHPYSLLNIQ
jgi:hypothetical protein